MAQIFLSACVIVKNEAGNLPRWLACMRALADEMVVVDTGSTDDTVALATQAGARVLHYAWQDDFAAAKNFAMAQARGRWLLLLDADEYIEAADFPALRQALRDADQQADVLGFALHLVNIDTDQHNRPLSEGWLLRVCRNLPTLRYHGAVHEALTYTGPGQRQMQLLPSVTVWHTGYSTHINRRKAERNLRLLLARREREGAQPLDDAYLADCYYTLGDYAQTIAHAARATQQSVQPAGRETRAYALWLQSLSALGRPLDEVEAVLAQAEQTYPDVPDYRVLAGEAAWQRGDYMRAAQHLHTSLARYAASLAQPGGQQASHSEMQALLPRVCWQLATLAHWRGHMAEAQALTAQGLQTNRYFAGNAQLWLQLQAKAGADAATLISGLARWYDKKRDAAFLFTLIPHNLPQVRLYYARQDERELTLGETYLLAGHLPAAAAALTESALCTRQLAVLALAHGAAGVHSWLSRAYDTARATTEAQNAVQRRWLRLQGAML